MVEEKKQVTLKDMRDWLEKMGVDEVRNLTEFLREEEELLSGECSAPTQNEVDFAVKRARERATSLIALLSQVPGGLDNSQKEEGNGWSE